MKFYDRKICHCCLSGHYKEYIGVWSNGENSQRKARRAAKKIARRVKRQINKAICLAELLMFMAPEEAYDAAF